MTEPKLTLGKAIDQIIEALGSFDDKDRKAILGTVCSHLQIDLGASYPAPSPVKRDAHGPSPGNVPDPTPPHAPRPVEHGLDIRRLKDEKKPNSARQMACLVAYYLQDHAPTNERKDSITTADLEKYFKQADLEQARREIKSVKGAQIFSAAIRERLHSLATRYFDQVRPDVSGIEDVDAELREAIPYFKSFMLCRGRTLQRISAFAC